MKQEDRENDKQGLVSMIRQTKNTLFISGMVLTLAGGLSRAHDEAVAINASFQLPVVEDAVADKGVRSDSLKALLPVYLEIQNITNSPITVSFNSEQSPVYFSEKDAVIKHPKGYPFVCINLALYPYTLKGGQTFISYFDVGQLIEFDKKKRSTLVFTVPVIWNSPDPKAGEGHCVRKEIRMEYIPR